MPHKPGRLRSPERSRLGVWQSQESHTTAVVPGRRLCESSSIRSSAAANSSRISDSGDSGV